MWLRDDRFHGGRCEVHTVNDFKSKGIKGKYIDTVSLYPTLMYYVRCPVGHTTKNCVLIIYAKKETTQLHKALDMFCYFP